MAHVQTLLPRNLAAIAKCCAKGEQLRYGGTTGIELVRDGNTYTATATDGRTLATVTGESAANPEEYPISAALASAANGADRALIPAKDWLAAFKLIPKQGRYAHKPILDNLAVIMSEKVTTLASTDLAKGNITEARNIETDDGKPARFPDWRKGTFPAGKPIVTFRIDPALFGQVLDAAAAFTTEDSKSVTVSVYPKEGTPIMLSAKHNETGQQFRGLVVPLISTEPAPKRVNSKGKPMAGAANLRQASSNVFKAIACLSVVLDKAHRITQEYVTRCASLSENRITATHSDYAEMIGKRATSALLALTAKYLS